MIGCQKYSSTIKGGFDFLNDDEFKELCSDGRFFSHLCEKYLSKLFPDLKKVPNSCNKGYDYYLNGMKVEVKTLTSSGFTTVPSYMIGANRKYDESEHRSIFDANGAYIIVNNVNFPEIDTYFILRNDSIFFKNKKSYKKSISLLDNLTSDSPTSVKNF